MRNFNFAMAFANAALKNTKLDFKVQLFLEKSIRSAARGIARQRKRYSKFVDWVPGAGKAEMARRRQQIEAGSLRVENGLVA